MAVQDYELLLRVRADLIQAINGLDNVKKKLGEGDVAAKKMAASGDKATTAMRALGSAIAAVGIAKLVKDYFSAADAASTLAAKVRLVTDSAAAQADAQRKLFALAQQTSASLENTTNLYVKLAQSSDRLRNNQDELLSVTRLLNESLVISGADQGSAASVTLQFSQAMAAGVLRGQDFNAVMAGSPRFAQAMADGLGVPLGALRKLANEGKLTADQVINALQSQSAAVHKEFSSIPVTVSGAMQKVRNSLLDMIGAADQNAGASRQVVDALEGLAGTLNSESVKSGFATMIAGLVNIARYASEAVGAISGLGKAVNDIFRSDSNKNYLALLAKRDALDTKITQTENNPIRRFFGLGKGDIAQMKSELAQLDELIRTKNAAQQAATSAQTGTASAASNAAAAADAEKTQLARLLDLQMALDPTIKIWADYNAVVAEQNKLSATQRAAAGADVVAINARRDAVIKLAAQQRDARLAALASNKATDAAQNAAMKAAADATQSQIQSLIALQAALDPTTKIWADYNAEVAKQADLAKTAKSVAGADVAAIDARRDAIIKLAATARDNSLAELAQKDKQAWESLRDSLRTPAEVRLEDALDKIRQLNELLAKGALTAPEYHDALKRIGTGAAPQLPDYQGVDAVVGGPAGELIKAAKASQALEQAHAEALAENRRFNAANAAEAEAAAAQLLAIEQDYQRKKAALDLAKQQLTLATAADGFGQLADVMRNAYGEQSKQYRIAFALQKSAAIAQSMLAIQTSIAESSKLGFPWNLVSIAGAIAQGIGLIASVRSVSFGGYSQGGYTGPGGKYQPKGVVHAGEVVWSQTDIARAGGVSVVEAMRRGYRGYADGGLVAHPLANAPPFIPPAGMGRASLDAASRSLMSASRGANDSTAAPAAAQDVKVVVVMDRDAMAEEIMRSPAGQKVIVQTAGDNPRAIQGKWGRGG